MNKTTNKYSPEVPECAVRMVLDGEPLERHWSERQWRTGNMRAAGPLPGRASRSDVPRGAIVSTASKIGCAPQTLNEWVKKVEVDTGQRGGITTKQAEKMKALEREMRELKQANEILRKASAFHPPLEPMA